jgi:hypothetical protein
MEESKLYGIFDYSELPLIKIEVTGEQATDEKFLAYLEEMRSIFSKAKRYISILDTTKGIYLPVKYRIMQGKYLETNKEFIEKQSIAAILIAPHFLQRTVLKAVFLIKPYPSQAFFVSTREEAIEKAHQLLEEETKKLEEEQLVQVE